MKKVKNNKTKESETSLEVVKEGKIKKDKQKKDKKLKDAVAKMEDHDLAPKVEKTNLKLSSDEAAAGDKTKKKNKKNKNKHKENQEATEVVANNEAKPEKQKKQKKPKKDKEDNQEKPETKTSDKELSEVDAKNIEKKKAKKLAQKLKKQQKKSENKEEETTAAAAPTTNGVKKGKKTEKPPKKNAYDPSNKVLSKKEKKAQKRQMMKEQKLAEKQNRDPAIEAATIFVGNLPVNTKRVQIVRLLKDFGPVNSIRLRSAGGLVLHKHKQRKNAGALNAYVVLQSKEKAEKAISLNGTEFKNHHLRVTLAAKNPQSHEKEEAKRTVFVGNLKYTATEESLREIFTSCGEIDYVRCLRDGDKGCKGVAYVCFKTPDAVGLALELNETMLDERPIHVERFIVKKLGAKEKRDAEAEKEGQSKKGAKQRIDGKKGKKDKLNPKKPTNNEGDEGKKPKKSEFRGVKVEGLKKKNKPKKKKSKDQNLQLAKKIAPKPKDE